MPQKAYLWILRIGVWLSFICVFFVFRGMLFPYITSKQIPFNIIMEVLFIFWLAFIVKYPQWNPFLEVKDSWPFRLFFKKKDAPAPALEAKTEFKNDHKNKKQSPAEDAMLTPRTPAHLATITLAAFFVVILISCFTGIDFHMSFWSNAERMLGVFHILHFFILYLIVITVMRDWKDWQLTFTWLALLAAGVAIDGFGGQNYSTLGNTLYASGFMIFAFYFVLFLIFHRDPKNSKKDYSFFKWFYLLILPFIFAQFRRADNTGAYVGIGAGVIIFIFLAGILNRRLIVKIISWVIAIAMVGGFAFVFTHHNSPFIAENKVLGDMNFNKITFQTRLISWRSAAKDFHNHWLIGTGFGNYAIVFDKYFSASFFNYTRSETYFDRAHNNLVDITSTTGILGITAYLSVFLAVGVYLIRALRYRRIKPLEFCLIASLLTAYFVQNLTVFDSFITYLCLMITLGYVHWLANTKEDSGNERALLFSGNRAGFVDKEIYTLLGAGLVMAFTIYSYGILPLGMLNGVIQGQMALSKGDIPDAIEIYKEALSHNTPIDKDGRSMLLRSVADAAWSIGKLDQKQAEDIFAFAIEEGQKNIAYNPNDSLMNMELARVYDAGFKAVKDEKKRAEYANQAINYIDRSIAASPERIPVYLVKSQFLIGQNRIDESITTLEKASGFNTNFYETYCQLGQIYLIKEDQVNKSNATSSAKELESKAWTALDNCLSHEDGASMIVVPEIIKMAINHYIDGKDVDRVIALYQQLIRVEGNNSQYLVTLARLYAEKGDKEMAKQTALQAAQADPKLKADADQFIKQLENQ
jgi:tetratricopeptide (TPR) repeat protein